MGDGVQEGAFSVLLRGNEQRDVFLDDEDRNHSISLMGEILG